MRPESVIESTQPVRGTPARHLLRDGRVDCSRRRAAELNGLAELLYILQGISDEMPPLCDRTQQRALQAMLDRASGIACRTIRRAAFADELEYAQFANSNMTPAPAGERL
jgi:hypothetical protein